MKLKQTPLGFGQTLNSIVTRVQFKKIRKDLLKFATQT
ncbi:hypothetical protein LEP1GSC073_2947 [Leptospira noguchii str. Cascata]|nr:hypothetical protein LEP1GSC073_2947 [Leptospira noguchii str. Cascata]